MNEKFLYRAKCIDADRWVEGNLLIDTCGCFICADLCINNRKYKDRHYGYEIMEIRAFEIDPSTICQCTAMSDKNRKIAYEHDIIKTPVGNAKIAWSCSKSPTDNHINVGFEVVFLDAIANDNYRNDLGY